LTRGHSISAPSPVRPLLRFGVASLTAAYLVRAVVVPALPQTITVGAVSVELNHALMLAFAVFAAAAGMAMLRRRCRVSGPAVSPLLVPLAGVATGATTGVSHETRGVLRR
jgi:hypothetical protein